MALILLFVLPFSAVLSRSLASVALSLPCQLPALHSDAFQEQCWPRGYPVIRYLCDHDRVLSKRSTQSLKRHLESLQYFDPEEGYTVAIVLLRSLSITYSPTVLHDAGRESGENQTIPVIFSDDQCDEAMQQLDRRSHFTRVVTTGISKHDVAPSLGTVSNLTRSHKHTLAQWAEGLRRRWFEFQSCGRNLLLLVITESLILLDSSGHVALSQPLFEVAYGKLLQEALPESDRHSLLLQAQLDCFSDSNLELSSRIASILSHLALKLQQQRATHQQEANHAVPVWAKATLSLSLVLIFGLLFLDWFIITRRPSRMRRTTDFGGSGGGEVKKRKVAGLFLSKMMKKRTSTV